MNFKGISRVFSTVNSQQYETIGRFWDELSKIYGRENLRGLGYNWTETSIEYAIGLKQGEIEGCNCEVILPDTGWVIAKGKTCELDNIYENIYEAGNLQYEIEMFNEDGTCEIRYYR